MDLLNRSVLSSAACMLHAAEPGTVVCRSGLLVGGLGLQGADHAVAAFQNEPAQ